MIKISPSKEKALAALLACPTRKAAAKMARISERTLYSYTQDPEFMERYQAECESLVVDAARQAQQTIAEALDTLKAVMKDKTAQSYARISAARSILEYSLKLQERCDSQRQVIKPAEDNDDALSASLRALAKELQSDDIP